MGISSITAKELRNIKIIFVFFIFFWSLMAGVLPAKIPACKNNTKFLGLVSAFSGGIFLAMALVHIMPEVSEEYTEYETERDPDRVLFPLPYFMFFCGYALILLVDKVLFDSHALFGNGKNLVHVHQHVLGDEQELDHGHDDQIDTGHGHQPDDQAAGRNEEATPQLEFENPLNKHNRSSSDLERNSQANKNWKVNNTVSYDPAAQKLIENTKKSMYDIETISQNNLLDKEQISKSMTQKNEEIASHFKSYHSRAEQFSVRMSAALKPAKGVSQEQQKLFVEEDNIELEEVSLHKEQKRFFKCNFTPFILMIALSFHSFFEGLALGLNLEPSVVINLMISIIIHKYAVCMSITTSLQKAFPNQFKMLFWLMFIYSFSTPIGVVLGMIMSGLSEMVDIVFMSMAGGTFLYVACSEIIVEEFSLPGQRIWKMLAFLFGAAVITFLWFLDKD